MVASNAYYNALSAFYAALLQSATTLERFTASVVSTTGNSVPSLPADLLLRPATSACSAMRSGRYRFVTPTPDAPIASQAGVSEQVHTVADLGGTWNTLGMTAGSTAFVPEAGTVTFDSAAKPTAGITCRNDTSWAIDACATVPDAILAFADPITAASGGGLEKISGGVVTTRLFAYKAGSGHGDGERRQHGAHQRIHGDEDARHGDRATGAPDPDQQAVRSERHPAVGKKNPPIGLKLKKIFAIKQKH